MGSGRSRGADARSAALSKTRKLFSVALDPGAAAGESDNAATLAVRLMRKHGLELPDVGGPAFEKPAPPPVEDEWPAPPPEEPGGTAEEAAETPPPPTVAEAFGMVMTFGKHQGKTLGWIFHYDNRYFSRLATKASRGRHVEVRQALATLWELSQPSSN